MAFTEATIRTADRVVLATGSGLAALVGAVVEDLDAATAARVAAALLEVVGDGAVTLSVDHQTVTVLPPSAAWVTRNAHQIALRGYITQHHAALQALYDQIATQAGSFAADLQTANQIIQAWIGGVAPTQAQALVLIRVIIRILVFQAS